MTLPGFEEVVVPAARPTRDLPSRRVVVVVCDSLGVGAAPGGDEPGADTLGNVARSVGDLELPTLARWGLGHASTADLGSQERPSGVVARLAPTAAGTDSTTGHWELMGVVTQTPFPTYPEGFPPDVIGAFEQRIGREVLGNRAASGTQIIEELGDEHLETGKPIVYTSADSVFQIACHEDVAPISTLYDWSRAARELLTGEHRVGRVIARPFRGEPGAFERTAQRRDLGVAPEGTTALDVLHRTGIAVVAVGKIEDLFDRRGIAFTRHTGDDESAVSALETVLEDGRACFVLANLVDLDQRYGHRNDPDGYARALERIDGWLGDRIAPRLRGGDRLVVTGDHGTDPTIRESTDHTREFVPAVAWGPDLLGGEVIGTRETMADLGATVLDLFGVDGSEIAGTSFAHHLA